MDKNKQSQLTPEEKEKQDIEWENKVLAILMPSVGGIALLIGVIGFILTIGRNNGIAVFLLIVAILGAGGVAYGVLQLIKKQKKKLHKEETVPSDKPNEKPSI